MRTLAVVCPRWPLVAAGVPPGEPAAVFHANRVVVASEAAAGWGIRSGMRRREAQARCPEVIVVDDDPLRDARAFEPVAGALDAVAPRLEIVRPGVCVLPARGAARYAGGEEQLCRKAAETVRGVLPDTECRTGIADGPFAAELAAHTGLIVASGGTREFLAPWPVDILDLPKLAGVLVRLGLRTLGDLAALPAGAVGARFGADGSYAHRLARGETLRPLALRDPPPDLVVRRDLEEPAFGIDAATFVAKAAADELVERLTARGLACAKLRIEAETEHGERLARTWRYTAAFTPAAVAERVRWQLEGWLRLPEPPTGGIAILELHPEDVGPATGVAAGFWGYDTSDRVRRALHRVQGLLGHEGAATPVLSGGRELREQVHLVPWGDPVSPARPGLPGDATQAGPVQVELPPWPGRLPAPAPALVHTEPVPADVADAHGEPVGVTGRFAITAAPARVRTGRSWTDVTGWAGPWPVDERWWDTAAHSRRARLQVALADGTAHLLTLEAGRWRVEATYD